MYHRIVRENGDQKGVEKLFQNSWKLPATYFTFCSSL